ncbi:MAG TPA: S8 family serine peptidase [Solirubrobacter sp.]|nr:S8 family serine peptidase [Solirubrobacter sp.]
MRAAALACLAGLALLTLVAAPASAWIPNDTGIAGRTPGGWQQDQWNFLPGTGVDAPRAWDNLIAAGRPGGKGVKIAVLDSGVSYRRSPELAPVRFQKGRDFCARSTTGGDLSCAGEDADPADDYGHGTHIASTIAERTNNGKGLTGLAYGATIIPVKVLDRDGDGDERSISKGLHYAADRGAQIINLSVQFGSSTDSAAQIPKIAAAVRYAQRKGALIVAAAGNIAYDEVAYPAALPGVLSVGAITEHGCRAVYSNTGPDLDLVAPGGGQDAAGCGVAGPAGRSILQLAFTRNNRVFRYPRTYYGTSMAAAHVTATAALVIASGVLGPHPTPQQIEERLKATARDLGAPGPDEQYGAGLVDAGAATSPTPLR